MLGTCRREESPMRVLVTGGTGYVGCHTVAALAGQGHQVRLLVRARDRIAPALDPLGVAGADAVVGDVTSAAAVEQAMLGCDAVVHAAAVFSLDPRRGAVMQQANPGGTATILEAAQRRGLDPIVYVSTIGVFVPVTGATLTAGTPVGAGIGPYTRSKIAAELVARGSQQAGSPGLGAAAERPRGRPRAAPASGAEQAALPLSIPAGVVVDDSVTRQELAVERRELRETLADTVRWLAARGLVTARQAGALAG
jgi:NAD(P)-dependent dehydrogenase (short-subunit alcohol dehydrogenase family)